MAGTVNNRRTLLKPTVGFRNIESPKDLDELGLYMIEGKGMPSRQSMISKYSAGRSVINSI
jgi:hypothetical protein